MDAQPAIPITARDAILSWYAARGRALAFRSTSDPYAVLVSELMAQQTQAERAARAWTAWIDRRFASRTNPVLVHAQTVGGTGRASWRPHAAGHVDRSARAGGHRRPRRWGREGAVGVWRRPAAARDA